MIELVVHLFVTAGLLMVVGHLVRGIDVAGGRAALLAALVLGVANAIIRPILVVLTLPFTIITLGLFLFVVNAIMLILAAAVVPGFRIRGFGAALVGSLLLAVLNLLVSILFGV